MYFLISAKNEISICNESPVAETTNLVNNVITKSITGRWTMSVSIICFYFTFWYWYYFYYSNIELLCPFDRQVINNSQVRCFLISYTCTLYFIYMNCIAPCNIFWGSSFPLFDLSMSNSIYICTYYIFGNFIATPKSMCFFGILC